MIAIKIILTPIIAILILQIFQEFQKSRIGIFWALFWLFSWFSVLMTLFYPNWTTQISNVIGIGRGIDFFIYSSIVTLFYLVFRLYIKNEKLNQKIAELSRKIALQHDKKT